MVGLGDWKLKNTDFSRKIGLVYYTKTINIESCSIMIIFYRSPSVSESSNDSSKASGPVNGNECYFWRTTGCVFESQCRYRHVRGHKGVDLAKVQAKYGNKLSS